jgi:ketol-acid reductoisomerase
VGTGYSAGSVMVYPTLDNTPFDTYKNTACTITVMSNTGSDVSYSYGYVNVLFTPTQPANSIVISYVTPGSSASDVRVTWKYPSGTYGVNSGYVVQLTEYQSGAITSSYNVTSSGTNNESLVISKNNLIPGVLYYVRITPYYKVVLNLT